MVSSPRVAVIDQDPDARFHAQQVLAHLGFSVVAQTGVGTEAVSAVVEAAPDIVLCGFREPVGRVAQTVESITHAATGVPVIAYAPVSSLDIVRQAMLAGARDFVQSPLKPEDLRRSLTAALEAGERRRLREGRGNLLGPEGAIITVFGAKGGVGKTTVAVNLAMGLVREAGQKVLLVDLDDTFGDGAAALSLQPELTVTDGLRALDAPGTLDSIITYHESGLGVIAGAASPFEWRGAAVENVAGLLRLAARQFDAVVVDTSANMSEVTQAALEAASIVLWVTTPDYASVRDTIQALQAVRSISLPEERVRFVLNLTSADGEVHPASVEDALQHQLFWIIPYDYEARRSGHMGRSVLDGGRATPAAVTFAELARAMSGLPARRKARRLLRRALVRPRVPRLRRRIVATEQEVPVWETQ